MKRFVIAAALTTGGCSWLFQDHVSDNFRGHSEPQCTTSTGYATADGIFVALNIADLIYGASNLSGDTQTAYVAGALLGALIHVASAGTGVKWAHACEDAREKWEEYDRHRQDVVEARVEAKATVDPPKPPVPDERKVLEGAKPLLCTESAAEGTTGECFIDQAACQSARAKFDADYTDCTERRSGACFNVSVTLDDKRLTICAPSVKDCEVKRREKAGDPDFTRVAEKCSIYRQRVQNDGPVEQSRDPETP